MEDQLPKPSKVTLYSGLSFLVALTIVSLVFSVSEFIDMSQQLSSVSDDYIFNKGVFYIPGVVLGLSVLIYVIVRESILRKHLTEKIASYCTRIGIGAVALMLVLPSLAEYSIDNYFSELNYQICPEASHQWLHSKIVAYTRDKTVCDTLVESNRTMDYIQK